MNVIGKPLVSRNHLASLLSVKRAELEEVADLAAKQYAPFKLQKKESTEFRDIDNPSARLKRIQRAIKARLLDQIRLPSFVAGGVRKRSTRRHAGPHVGKREVLVMDIAHFFPSVSTGQIAALFQHHFQTSSTVTWLLTRLVTCNGHLPQGSPASSAVANLAILPAALELDELCRTRGLAFTIYVDDIAISGRDVRSVISEVFAILARHGFRVKREKLRIISRSQRQTVAGHVVNRKLSNSRDRLAGLRRQVVSVGDPHTSDDDVRRIVGRVAHASWTSPSQARWLLRTLNINQFRRALARARK